MILRAVILFLIIQSSRAHYKFFKNNNNNNNKLQIIHQWKYLDWLKPNIALTGKNFILGNPITQDVEVDIARNRVFVTSPHWLEGNAITLSVVTRFQGPGGPLLRPYPDWTWHRNTSCDGIIVSVYRVAIDECNRLWVVDNGNNGRTSICPQKLLIFDLRTDKLIHSHTFPTSEGLSQLVTPIVEIGATCLDAHLYIADPMRRGLVVYSLKEDRSWRWNNTQPGNAFGFEDDSVDLNIAGEAIQLRDGILGMSLSPKGFFDERYLFFNAMGSYYEKFASVKSLKNEGLSEPEVYRSIQRRISQAGPQATSRTGAVFFQLAQMTAIACWNMEKPFTPENVVIVAQDRETLQYAGGMKVKVNRYGREELWFNTNRLQKTITASRSMNEVNFRVISGYVDELIHGTNCESTLNHQKTIDSNSWERI